MFALISSTQNKDLQNDFLIASLKWLKKDEIFFFGYDEHFWLHKFLLRFVKYDRPNETFGHFSASIFFAPYLPLFSTNGLVKHYFRAILDKFALNLVLIKQQNFKN